MSCGIRCSAMLTPPAPGQYRLGLHLGFCYACWKRVTYRMFLDGKLLLDSTQTTPGDADPNDASVPVELSDIQEHRLVVEYAQRNAGGDIVWQAPKNVLLDEAA